MPNWCKNFMIIGMRNEKDYRDFVNTFFGCDLGDEMCKPFTEQNYEVVAKAIADSHGNVPALFEAFAPQPEAPYKVASHEGFEWRINNWGVKWDALDLVSHFIPIEEPTESGYTHIISMWFSTAWDPSWELSHKIFQRYEGCYLSHIFIEEMNRHSGLYECGEMQRTFDLSHKLWKQLWDNDFVSDDGKPMSDEMEKEWPQSGSRKYVRTEMFSKTADYQSMGLADPRKHKKAKKRLKNPNRKKKDKPQMSIAYHCCNWRDNEDPDAMVWKTHRSGPRTTWFQ